MYNIDFSILLKDSDLILSGISTTILVSVCAGLLSFTLGSIFVYFKTSPRNSTKKITNFLVDCIRNTPLLIIIYLFYKGLPSIGITFSALMCGILALGIYTAAYISDALMSGINAIPAEHIQASSALGLTRFQTFQNIIYPQALRHSIHILGSQYMNMIKNSSLVSFIAVSDIFYVVYKGIADSYRIYEYFILAIVIYCSMSAFVLLLTNILNKIYKIPTTEVSA